MGAGQGRGEENSARMGEEGGRSALLAAGVDPRHEAVCAIVNCRSLPHRLRMTHLQKNPFSGARHDNMGWAGVEVANNETSRHFSGHRPDRGAFHYELHWLAGHQCRGQSGVARRPCRAKCLDLRRAGARCGPRHEQARLDRANRLGGEMGHHAGGDFGRVQRQVRVREETRGITSAGLCL